MKNITKEARNGLKFTCLSPENVEEFDQLAGRVGACLEGGTDDIWYRGVFPEIWFWLAQRLLQDTKIPRKMKDHPEGKQYAEGDRKGQVIQVAAESDPQYVDRVAGEKGVLPTSFQPLVDEICGLVGPVKGIYGTTEELGDGEKLIAFDPARRTRQPRSIEPGKDDLEVAKSLLEQNKKQLKVTLAKLKDATGQEVVLADDSDPEAPAKNLRALGLAVKAYKRAMAEAAKNQLKA
jgi:hypothetical protein